MGIRLEKEEEKMNGRDGRREEGKEAGREVASQVRAREHDGMDPKGLEISVSIILKTTAS